MIEILSYPFMQRALLGALITGLDVFLLVLQTRGPDHIDSVLSALHRGGFQAQRQ